MIKMEFGAWRRVSKRTAEKLYNAGAQILLCPCKQNPVSPLALTYLAGNDTEYQFWETVRFFQKYECTPETGRYPSYYVEVKE